MALTSVNFKATLQINLKKFLFEDITDYAAQGVTLANIKGAFTVVANGNTSYNGNLTTPDTDGNPATPAITLTNNLISLPLDGSGSVILGKYDITYTVTDAITTISKILSFTLDYKTPTGELLLTADCVKPLLKSEDKTNYTVGGINPVITRTHAIKYPPTVNMADITGTTAIIQTLTFFTLKNEKLQHSSTLTSNLTYDFGTFFITDVVKDEAFNSVSCDPVLCDIYCCLKAEFKRYLSQRGINDVLARKHQANFNLMNSLAMKIKIALECGKGDDVSALANELLKTGGCESGCDCADGKPQLVTGLSGSSGTSVVTGTAPIAVTPTVAGQVTTYNVVFDATLVTKLNELEKINVIPGDMGINVTSAIVSGIRVFTVLNLKPDTHPHVVSGIIKIIFGAKGTLNSPTVSIIDTTLYGTALKAPSITAGPWTQAGNYFILDAFRNLSGVIRIKPMLQKGTLLQREKSLISNVLINIADMVDPAGGVSGSILFSIIDFNGVSYSGSALNDSVNQLEIIFNIIT